MVGTIKTLIQDKGFGFILEEGTNVEHFFHRSALKNAQFEDVKIGDKVSFESTPAQKGPRAEDVYTQA